MRALLLAVGLLVLATSLDTSLYGGRYTQAVQPNDFRHRGAFSLSRLLIDKRGRGLQANINP